MGWRVPDGSIGKDARFGIWVLAPDEVEQMRAGQVKESRWTLWKRWSRLGTCGDETKN
jgi:hypothetical protein